MKKGCCSDFFNSHDGRVNLALLISTIVVFLLSFFIVEAISWDNYLVTLAPSNFSYNGSNTPVARNINFTFNITWQGATQNISNCSLWVNDTGILKGWQGVKNISPLNNTPDDRVQNYSGTATTISYMNYTFNNSDGNYTFWEGNTFK